jgi:hypothetical protein
MSILVLQDSSLLSTENSRSLTVLWNGWLLPWSSIHQPIWQLILTGKTSQRPWGLSLHPQHCTFVSVLVFHHVQQLTVLFSFFRSVNNCEEVNSYSLYVSLLVSWCLWSHISTPLCTWALTNCSEQKLSKFSVQTYGPQILECGHSSRKWRVIGTFMDCQLWMALEVKLQVLSVQKIVQGLDIK